MIHGILPVDKPLGCTSHDAVARVRRATGQRAVGHAGTLDPLATGVLLLVLGQATRLSSHLMEGTKVYCAEVVLGATTATDDGEAPLLERADVGSIDRATLERALDSFVGEIAQLPPAYAAVRHEGKKLYTLARQGVEVERAPRRVTVHGITLLGWRPPRLRLRVECGSGTYIRSLARDIGHHLGVGGYLHALRRVRSGSFTLRDCCPLDELQSRAEVARGLHSSDRAVWDWPAVVLDTADATAVRHGRPVSVGGLADGRVRLYGVSGVFLALAESVAGTVKPYRVFDEGP